MKRKPKVARLWATRPSKKSGLIEIWSKRPKLAGSCQVNGEDFLLYRSGGDSVYICQKWLKRLFGFLPTPGSCQRVRVTLEVEP